MGSTTDEWPYCAISEILMWSTTATHSLISGVWVARG